MHFFVKCLNIEPMDAIRHKVFRNKLKWRSLLFIGAIPIPFIKDNAVFPCKGKGIFAVNIGLSHNTFLLFI